MFNVNWSNVNWVDHGGYYWLVVNYVGHGRVMADIIGELCSM
jgi:hypothetical protein